MAEQNRQLRKELVNLPPLPATEQRMLQTTRMTAKQRELQLSNSLVLLQEKSKTLTQQINTIHKETELTRKTIEDVQRDIRKVLRRSQHRTDKHASEVHPKVPESAKNDDPAFSRRNGTSRRSGSAINMTEARRSSKKESKEQRMSVSPVQQTRPRRSSRISETGKVGSPPLRQEDEATFLIQKDESIVNASRSQPAKVFESNKPIAESSLEPLSSALSREKVQNKLSKGTKGFIGFGHDDDRKDMHMHIDIKNVDEQCKLSNKERNPKLRSTATSSFISEDSTIDSNSIEGKTEQIASATNNIAIQNAVTCHASKMQSMFAFESGATSSWNHIDCTASIEDPLVTLTSDSEPSTGPKPLQGKQNGKTGAMNGHDLDDDTSTSSGGCYFPQMAPATKVEMPTATTDESDMVPKYFPSDYDESTEWDASNADGDIEGGAGWEAEEQFMMMSTHIALLSNHNETSDNAEHVLASMTPQSNGKIHCQSSTPTAA
jgi:hypothetical protein